MRWRQGRRSSNIEDRRGQPVSRKAGVAGGGIGTILIVLVAMYFGVDPSQFLGQGGGTVSQVGGTSSQRTAPPGVNDEMKDFISVVVGYTEDVWHEQFRQIGQRYQEPKLVIFSGATSSACGQGQAAMGPFYCPADQNMYIDLSFYQDLKSRFKAPGDFAQAYVIAHEAGHHVQNLLGISSKVFQQRQRVSKAEGNKLSVRQELQADCFAGVWAHHAHRAANILERGDVEEALTAAAAIGDDRLQKQATGHIVPESFTHGTSAQRVKWFRMGLEFGDLQKCDTFAARSI